MKVLIIGSGGREHALLQACMRSDLVTDVIAAPGNGGMAQQVKCFPLDVNNVKAAVKLAQDQATDLVIVGPEAPLAIGLVDALHAVSIQAYGPNKKAARLEASKAFSKQFLNRHKIPTANAVIYTELDPALQHIEKCSYPIVIKASGLAAGKGVIIVHDIEQARSTLKGMLESKSFGDSGNTVLIEDFMVGEEASIMLMVSGKNYVQLPASQDHKRIGEKDTGPNTGGMGAYAPTSVVTPLINQKVKEQIIEPTLAGLITDGIDYKGTLYIGIMLVDGEPKVVEYNVRFGDPECQILFPLLEDDLIRLMLDCANGSLVTGEVSFKDESAVIVVQSAEGYPDSYTKGDVITVPDTLEEGTSIIHAGTKLNDNGEIVTAGGRVLGVVAHGPDLQQAIDKAYRLTEKVTWRGRYYRKDIAWRELARQSK